VRADYSYLAFSSTSDRPSARIAWARSRSDLPRKSASRVTEHPVRLCGGRSSRPWLVDCGDRGSGAIKGATKASCTHQTLCAAMPPHRDRSLDSAIRARFAGRSAALHGRGELCLTGPLRSRDRYEAALGQDHRRQWSP
jgi:hypothetical protein